MQSEEQRVVYSSHNKRNHAFIQICPGYMSNTDYHNIFYLDFQQPPSPPSMFLYSNLQLRNRQLNLYWSNFYFQTAKCSFLKDSNQNVKTVMVLGLFYQYSQVYLLYLSVVNYSFIDQLTYSGEISVPGHLMKQTFP